MNTAQAGIFALGTSSHAYLEFDLLHTGQVKAFASSISTIREPRTTTGGVNFVIGFRPELWRDMVPEDAPAGVEGFNHDIKGTEGFVMPGTQHDALVWLSGSAYDVIFDMARSVIHDLAGHASLGEETSSWPYRHDRDLTGFITKHRISAFAGTGLAMILRANDIDTLVLCGIATSGVVLSTLIEAADADYRLVVISDCCADLDSTLHDCLIQRFFPTRGSVFSSEDFVVAGSKTDTQL